eukprot:110498_1
MKSYVIGNDDGSSSDSSTPINSIEEYFRRKLTEKDALTKANLAKCLAMAQQRSTRRRRIIESYTSSFEPNPAIHYQSLPLNPLAPSHDCNEDEMAQPAACNHLNTCSDCRRGWTQNKTFKGLLSLQTHCKSTVNAKQKDNKKSTNGLQSMEFEQSIVAPPSSPDCCLHYP